LRANPTLPPGTNPLAKRIANMLKAARKKVGLSRRKFAERASIPLTVLQDVEDARYVAAPWILARIDSVLGGEIFQRQSPVRPKPRIGAAPGWQAYRLRLDPGLTERIRRVSSAMGLSVEAACTLALEYWLDSPGLLATFEEVSRRINRARLIDALGDNPVYRQFLARDLDLCKELGAEINEPQEEKASAKPVNVGHVDRLLERAMEAYKYDIEEI